MNSTTPAPTLRQPILGGILIVLLCALPVQPVQADDELRAGAVLQIPFAIGSSASFDPTNIRLGLTCQFANVEEDEITTYRTIEVTNPDNPLLLNSSVEADEGDQVYGVEGNLFIEVFNGFNSSVEVLGIYGTKDIQGAAGAGYSLEDGFFLDAKAMFPYAEVGLRFPSQVEIYAGAKTLGSFKPAQDHHTVDNRVIVVPEP